jgi:hypothetical protein
VCTGIRTLGVNIKFRQFPTGNNVQTSQEKFGENPHSHVKEGNIFPKDVEVRIFIPVKIIFTPTASIYVYMHTHEIP